MERLKGDEGPAAVTRLQHPHTEMWIKERHPELPKVAAWGPYNYPSP